MSSLTLILYVKFMPSQLSRFIQLTIIKDTLTYGWHVSKIYKHMLWIIARVQKST
jgi:hypothetical protein